jgi:hypothetical protein
MLTENPTPFSCVNCEYITGYKKDFNKHLLTSKHIKLTNGNDLVNIKVLFTCAFCKKEYKSRVGLWKHNKLCKVEINSNTNDHESKNVCQYDPTNLIMMLIKENSEMKNLMVEQSKETNDFKNLILEIVKKDTYQSTINTNSHNKTFNLQFFLNETCKDAMNIMEFVDSIKLQLSDLENVGQVGYVEGISNIIVKNLNALDINKRPVHCTDKKREVLYVKDENKWEKENDEKKKIRKMIKYIASKNQRMLPKFKEAHPDCNKSISKFSDKYNKILVESMGGSGDNDLEKEDKIIRNISKNIIVDKES